VAEITKVIPLEEALKAVDSAEADADRTRRAQKWAEELKAESGPGRRSIALDPYARVVFDAGTSALSEALEPFRYERNRFPTPTESEKRVAEQQVQRNVDALVVRQLKIYLRAADVREVYADPERMSHERVWNAYTRGVGAIAFTKGSGEAEFLRRWRDLLHARNDAEAYGDDVRAIERRLDRLTAPVTYPQYPAAAWDAADTLPEADRQAEYDRLEQKYGPRNATTNGTAVTKFRNRRETRPRAAMSSR
jgi:hypothetical protein